MDQSPQSKGAHLKGVALAMMTILVLSISGVAYYDKQINDPSQPAQLGSRLPVTTNDLAKATPCAQDVVGAKLRQGMAVSRHELVMTEWRCDSAAREVQHAKDKQQASHNG